MQYFSHDIPRFRYRSTKISAWFYRLRSQQREILCENQAESSYEFPPPPPSFLVLVVRIHIRVFVIYDLDQAVACYAQETVDYISDFWFECTI